ncbi:cytochrome d ubiquinol oxidase subunit II [Herbaspirillum sp. ST 5-3]|uniref:cytochrome d ubiquinol oxidase subunit II n=1 Tax=Oxalobacteraceae TaxID=75682 RepID=UPI0010A40594|nr:cytochrome d ubiquinol oxidase subunit II [Herbaspirillum sp. ST 5-3]
MSTLEYTLPVIWALVIGLAVALYVVLDGFDLGIGILFPFFKTEAQRDQAMNTVAPFWDGNETWLVMGGGGLWVAFPKAYAVLMPAVYLPIIVMLLALIFRGVAFEFRWIAKPRHRKWDLAFAAGSTLAAFAQGVVLGALLQEIHVANGQFAGGALDWLTPFSLMCGVALVVGYALLGATWLMMKAGGEVEQIARRVGMPLLLGLLAFIAIVSVWTPLQIERIAERWFRLPDFYWLALLPLATLLLAWLCWRGIQNNRAILPFASAVGLFMLAYAGLVISNAPYLIPPSITLWDAAAHPSSQVFLLIGAVILLPMIIGYTVFVFWVFRGKVQPGEGYH